MKGSVLMRYPKLNYLKPDGKIYFDQVMGLNESFIPPGSYSTAHAPTLLKLPNGDLLCAWFAGSFEGSADISIVCARLSKSSGKWEEPVQVSNDKNRSEQNPSLFLSPEGEVWLVYTSQLDRVNDKTNMQYTSVIKYQKSLDNGKSWQKSEVLFNNPGSFCRQAIQILTNGRWIFSNWLCFDDKTANASDYTVFQISDDQGQNWKTVIMPESQGRVHANIVELEPGHLIAFMRSRAADFIYSSESFDNGDSWQVPQATVLPNNNSSISAIKTNSGKIAIAYNPTRSKNKKSDQATWPGLRCPIAVALSEDGGKTWPLKRKVEMGEGFFGAENQTNNKQYEYPYLIQDQSDVLHLAFAYQNRKGIKYIYFEESDITGEKREKETVYNPTSAQV